MMTKTYNPAQGMEVHGDLPQVDSIVYFETDYERKAATVVGHGFVDTTSGPRPMLLVSLGVPLHSNMDDLYVTDIVLHPGQVTDVQTAQGAPIWRQGR